MQGEKQQSGVVNKHCEFGREMTTYKQILTASSVPEVLIIQSLL